MRDVSAAFPLFGSLPAELRAEIWRHASSGRLLHLKFMHKRKFLTLAPRKGIPFIPTLLHTCQESRQLSLKSYRILVLHPRVESRVLVNFEIDTIFFSDRLHRRKSDEKPWDESDSPLLLGCWDARRGTNVCFAQRVAFSVDFFAAVTRSISIPRAFICNFTHVKSITWVVSKNLLEKKVVVDGWTTRFEALLAGDVDEFGFEEVREDNALAELYKIHGSTLIRWMEWDLTEWKDLPVLQHTGEESDPRFEYRAGSGALGTWPRTGRIRDPRLMSKQGFWDKTNIRVAVDHDLFPLEDTVLERLKRKHDAERERRRKIRARGTIMIIRTVDGEGDSEAEKAIGGAGGGRGAGGD